jgi:hypothetical protein
MKPFYLRPCNLEHVVIPAPSPPVQVHGHEPDIDQQLQKLMLDVGDREQRLLREEVLVGEISPRQTALLEHRQPLLVRHQRGDVVAVARRELPLLLVGLVPLPEGRHERALVAEARRHRQRRVHAREDSPVQEQLPYPHVHRQRGQVVSERRQLVGLVEGAGLPQPLDRHLHVLLLRGLDQTADHVGHVSLLEVLQELDVEDELVQRDAVHLGDGLRQHLMLVPVGRVEVEADARHDAARTPLALEGVGPRRPHHLEALHVAVGVEVLLSHPAGVDHEDAVVDGDGGFGDVRREDYLPRALWFPKTTNSPCKYGFFEIAEQL